LRTPKFGERTTEWVCTACGTHREGVLAKVAILERLQHIRPARIDFDRENVVLLPEAIADFVTRMSCEKSYWGSERRVGERHNTTVPVAVIPLGDAFQPTEDPFMGITRDISTTGVALIATRAVRSRFFAVEFTSRFQETTQMVVRAVRCRPIRHLYEIAGPFFSKMQE